MCSHLMFFFFQAEDGIRDADVTGVQTCALPISSLRGNGLGGDGVADNVKLMSLRAVPDGDEFDKDVALAIRYAVDNGAKVINGSFGKSYSSLPHAVYEAIM